MTPGDEEFDLLIIILKKLCVTGCKKGVTSATSKDNTWILCARFTWGILSSLLTLIIAITGKCQFFTDVTVDKESTSLSLFIDQKTLADLNVCDSTSKFHDTSSPTKVFTEALFKKESNHAPKNVTATLDGNIPFTFLTISFFAAALIFLIMFFGLMIGKCCGGNVGLKLVGLLRYLYKAMSISISTFILIYNCNTFNKVDQNIASITTLVLSVLSLFFAIVMIIRYIYKTHCKKKKDSEPDS